MHAVFIFSLDALAGGRQSSASGLGSPFRHYPYIGLDGVAVFSARSGLRS